MGAIFEIIMQVLAGVGLTVGIEKFFPAPNPINPETGIKSWGPLRIAVFVLVMAAGSFLLIFLSKKLGLKIFKSRR